MNAAARRLVSPMLAIAMAGCYSQSFGELDLQGASITVTPTTLVTFQPAEVTLTLRRGSGVASPGLSTKLVIDGAVISQPTAVTDAQGEAHGRFYGKVSGRLAVGASFSLGGASFDIPATAYVDITDAPTSLAQSPNLAGRPGSVVIMPPSAQYAGVLHFTSSDAKATLPADTPYIGDATLGMPFAGGVTFRTAGPQTLTATDVSTGRVVDTQSFDVSPNVSVRLALTASQGQIVAGTPITLAVTSYDAYDNTATAAADSLVLSADLGDLPPLNFQLANGTYTVDSYTLTVAGVRQLSVHGADPNNSISSRISVEVAPSTTTALHVQIPSRVVVMQNTTVTVTAEDAYGNTTPGYLGDISFSSPDPNAQIPEAVTLSAANLGMGQPEQPASFSLVGPGQLCANDASANLQSCADVRVDATYFQPIWGDVCINAAANSNSIGTALIIDTCGDQRSEQWQRVGELLRNGDGRCIDAGPTGQDGDLLTLGACGSSASTLQWTQTGSTFASVAYPGKCIDLTGFDPSRGNFIQLYGCNATPAQSFVLVTNLSRLQPQSNTLACLGTADDAQVAGASVLLRACNPNTSTQQWDLRHGRIATGTDLCIACQDTHLDTNATFTLQPCDASVEQSWTYDSDNQVLRHLVNPNVCMVAPTSSIGAPALVAPCSSNDAVSPAAQWFAGATPMRFTTDPNMCIEATSSTAEVARCDGGPAQLWQFRDQQMQTSGGRCLALPLAQLPNQPVVLYPCIYHYVQANVYSGMTNGIAARNPMREMGALDSNLPIGTPMVVNPNQASVFLP